MADTHQIRVKGLYTYPNPLGECPPGSLSVADNIVIDADGAASSRRGLSVLAHPIGTDDSRANKLFSYQDQLLAQYDADKLAYYDAGSGWVDYSGTVAPIDSATCKVRSAQANSNFYLTTAAGVQKLDAYNSTPTLAGGVKALDLSGDLTGGGSGFFATNSQVAYRALWGYKDANSNLILGVPSQRCVVTNASGSSSDVDLELTIPGDVTVNWFFQLYRSPQSVSSATEPNDECQLVYEANPTSGEISAGTISVTDSTPDSLRGATIYTASSQEGILQENDPPPLAKDITPFRTMLLYANTTSKYQLSLTLLSVGGTNGLGIGDELLIDSLVYTAAVAENVSMAEFKVFSGGTPAQNIADTALSLCRVINQFATNGTIYAYYLSGYSELPGQILLEARTFGPTTFSASVTAHGSAWNPALPPSGNSVAATRDTYKNAIYVSKLGQPEAVPLTNQFLVGSAAYEIKRIIPLRDSVFIFKDDGIFKLIGQTPNTLYVDLFDNTTKLISPETAVPLNNSIYCLTNQGVVSVSDTGIAVVSRPIEGDILELLGTDETAVRNLSFGVSYESDRKYILSVITAAGDTVPTQIYVYNLFTNAWTRWPLSKVSGIIHSADGKLYFGAGDSDNVNVERKSYDYTDYIDDSYDLTIVSSSSTTVVVTSTADVTVGDLLVQGSKSVITEIVDTVTLKVASVITWSAGAAFGFKAIDCAAQFQPQLGEDPGALKQFSEVEIFLRNADFNRATISFFSDASPSIESIELTNSGTGRFGQFTFGTGFFGGGSSARPVRQFVPKNKQRCSQLNLKYSQREAYSSFYLEGFNLKVRGISTRVGR